MSTQTIAQRLAEIAAREQAATKGPWGFYDGSTYIDIAADLEMTGIGSYSYREKIAQLDDQDPPEELDEDQASELMTANAEFIASAREDIPFLLAEVARLTSELAEFEASVPADDGEPVIA